MPYPCLIRLFKRQQLLINITKLERKRLRAENGVKRTKPIIRRMLSDVFGHKQG